MGERDRWRRLEMHRMVFMMRTIVWFVVCLFSLGTHNAVLVFGTWVLYVIVVVLLVQLTPIKLSLVNPLLIPVDILLISYAVYRTGGLASPLYLLYGIEALILTAYGALRWSALGSLVIVVSYGLVTNGWDDKTFWWRSATVGLYILFAGLLGTAFRRTRAHALENQRRLEQITALKSLQELVVGDETFDVVIATLLQNAIGLVGAKLGYVVELTVQGILVPLANIGMAADAFRPPNNVYENSMEAWALKHGAVGIHLLKNVDPEVVDHGLSTHGVDQVAVVALTDMNHLVGVLVLAGNHFGAASDDGAMETLAGIIINQLRYDAARREAQKRGRLLSVLERVGRLVNRNLEMSILLKSLHQAVSEELETDSFFVALNIPNDPNHVLMRYLYDDGQEYPPEVLPLTPGGPTAIVLATGEPKIFNGDPDNSQLAGSQKASLGMLVSPLIHEGRVIGAISAQSYQKEYDQDHLEFLSAIASQASIAIQNAQLYQQTQAIALTDHLTGLGNSRHFSLVLPAAIDQAVRRAQPLSLLVIDSDSLKQINDRYGHTAGDAHLQMLAQAIQRSIRDYDSPCRYAGDEFVVILPGSNVDEAVTVAERIRQEMDQRFAWREAGMIGVTISVGVAELKNGMTSDELFSAADRAMYFAKQQGKNQVVAI
ncbi:MAG: sensor domain-containing diguanylate cyclase [Firmicutes bacterium]|nr:sensor domain-containing diguanylate cyclase [Bacillota bacterium]